MELLNDLKKTGANLQKTTCSQSKRVLFMPPKHVDDSAVSDSEIKILHLLMDKRKQSRLFDNLVTGLDKATFTQVICYLIGDEVNQSSLEKQKYKVISLPFSKKYIKKLRTSVVRQLAKIIEEHEIDIVHCQRHKPTVYGTLAAWLSNRKVQVLTTVHGRNRTRTLGRKITNTVLFKKITHIISVSLAVRDDILETNWNLSPNKVVNVYNGIDTTAYSKTALTKGEARNRLGIPPGAGFVFGTVGRLTEVKGHDILLKSFAKVIREFPDSCLVIAGEGRLEQELRALAKALNINNKVFFLGFRNDIPNILRAYDCFVLPSLSEGHPLSLLESMAACVPVIASNVGGVPEILDGFNSNMLVRPSSVEDLSTSMIMMGHTDETKRDAVGKELRNRVLNCFTKETMTSAMANEYISIMAEPASR